MGRRALLVTAAAIGLIALALVLIVGLRPITGFPDLSPLGGYDGAIAYSEHSSRETCIHAVDLATGEELFDPYCSDWVGLIDFTERGVYVDGEDGFTLIPLDGSAPEPSEPPGFREDEAFEREAVELPVQMPGDERRRTLVIDGVTVLEVDGPGDYELQHYDVSPDGTQLIVFDSIDRLIVTRTDGTGTPNLVADHADWGLWQAVAVTEP